MKSTKGEEENYKKLLKFVKEQVYVTNQSIREEMKCGFNQARKYIDQLEEDGALGTKPQDRYEEAKRFVIWKNKAIISQIQYKLQCGFRETCDYIDRLEAEGFISDTDGMTPRKILVKNRYLWLIKDYFKKRRACIKRDEENYQLVKNVIIKNRRPSIPLIQHVMKIGWKRAEGYMKRLEREGIVSKDKPDSPREVLVEKSE